MIDIDLQRLPDVLTLPSYPVGIALARDRRWVDDAPHAFVRALLGMAALAAFYGVVWLRLPGRNGPR